uniref:Uncharacterized protein n=1 Tax=Mycena chlorophos TaxID=658473 RepID=A0ABQ0MB24_MYCCL|nr:predicted protein [Mycena chlorophos]
MFHNTELRLQWPAPKPAYLGTPVDSEPHNSDASDDLAPDASSSPLMYEKINQDPFVGMQTVSLKDYMLLQEHYDRERRQQEGHQMDYRLLWDDNEAVLKQLNQLTADMDTVQEQGAAAACDVRRVHRKQHAKINALQSRVQELSRKQRLASDENTRLNSQRAAMQQEVQRERSLLAEARAFLLDTHKHLLACLSPFHELLQSIEMGQAAVGQPDCDVSMEDAVRGQ